MPSTSTEMITKEEQLKAAAEAISKLPIDEQPKKMEELLAVISLSDRKIIEAVIQKLLTPASWMTEEQKQWHQKEVVGKLPGLLKTLLKTYDDMESARALYAKLKLKTQQRNATVTLHLFAPEDLDDVTTEAKIVGPPHIQTNFKGKKHIFKEDIAPHSRLFIQSASYDILKFEDDKGGHEAAYDPAKGIEVASQNLGAGDGYTIKVYVKVKGKPTQIDDANQKDLENEAKKRGANSNAAWRWPEKTEKAVTALLKSIENLPDHYVSEKFPDKFVDYKVAVDFLKELAKGFGDKDENVKAREEFLAKGYGSNDVLHKFAIVFAINEQAAALAKGG